MVSRGIAVLGAGLLGGVLAERLVGAGCRVRCFDPDPARRAALGDRVGTWAETPAEAVESAEAIVSCVPDGSALLGLVEKPAVRAALQPGCLWIDCTTCHPDQARRAARELAALRVDFIEAPFSGGSQAVRAGSALLLVAGEPEALDRAGGLLDTLSPRKLRVGAAGTAASLKLVTNLVLGLNRLALAEGLALAGALGLPSDLALEALREGAARSAVMEAKGGRMAAGRFTEPDARLRQHLKDVELICELGEASGQVLPVSRLHRELLRRGVQLGLGDLDNAAILEVLRGFPVERAPGSDPEAGPGAERP